MRLRSPYFFGGLRLTILGGAPWGGASLGKRASATSACSRRISGRRLVGDGVPLLLREAPHPLELGVADEDLELVGAVGWRLPIMY